MTLIERLEAASEGSPEGIAKTIAAAIRKAGEDT